MGGSRVRLQRTDTALLLVDAQVKLAAAMPDAALAHCIRQWTIALELAGRLKLPVAISEQYPQGLGRTLPVLNEVATRLSPPPLYFDKTSFSCLASPMFERFLAGGRRTLLVMGMETHVCVFQTARDLAERGYTVHVPRDAVLSRKAHDYEAGLELIRAAGGVVTSTEAMLFDLVGDSAAPEFKSLSKAIR